MRKFLFGKSVGTSLIELGMVMVVISLALAPVVRLIGGPSSAEGNVERVTAQKNKEIILANALIERVVSGDYDSLTCDPTNGPNNDFVPFTSFPGFPGNPGTQVMNFPANGLCSYTQYNKPLYYRWTIRNADPTNNGTGIPSRNHYYQAVLNIWDEPTGTQAPILFLPTTFFWNEVNGANTANRTGIVVVLDVSGSMHSGQDSPPAAISVGGVSISSPYLWYRYRDPALGFVPPNGITLDLDNNTQLDIVAAQDADDPTTEWNEMYPKPGVMGSPAGPPNCGNAGNGTASVWTNSIFAFNSIPIPNARRNNVQAICNATAANWEAAMNTNMSRIEAARGSLLNFLLSLERDPQLYRNTSLGFVTFDSTILNRVAAPLEVIDANNRYPRMRRAFSWINRRGPGNIPSGSGTNMYGGIQRGASLLFADNTLDNRIIFVVGDGAPTQGPTSHAAFIALGNQIGNGTFPGANGRTATIFTLGLLSNDPQLPVYLRDDLAMRTPGGQFFFASNVGDVSRIFDQIKAQLERVILFQKSGRYNLDFT